MIVTAVVPVHNHVKWLNTAVDSLLKQTRPPDRLIIVDDGSTDGSLDTVLKRMKKPIKDGNGLTGLIYPYKTTVKALQLSEAHGPSVARNVGIEEGWDGTNVFALLDSDDEYLPTKIEKSLPRFLDDAVGIVYSDYYTYNEETGLRVNCYKPAFSRELLLKECIINCDSLVSRATFEQIGLFDPELRCCEDYDAWLRGTEHRLAVHIPEILIKIRVGQHSSTDTLRKELWNQCYTRVFQKMKERH